MGIGPIQSCPPPTVRSVQARSDAKTPPNAPFLPLEWLYLMCPLFSEK